MAVTKGQGHNWLLSKLDDFFCLDWLV